MDHLRTIPCGREGYHEGRTSIEMPATNLFGSELTGLWQNSVRESGNYGEMFSRNLDGLVVRDGLNVLNRLDGPQLCASPGTAPFI